MIKRRDKKLVFSGIRILEGAPEEQEYLLSHLEVDLVLSPFSGDGIVPEKGKGNLNDGSPSISLQGSRAALWPRLLVTKFPQKHMAFQSVSHLMGFILKRLVDTKLICSYLKKRF